MDSAERTGHRFDLSAHLDGGHWFGACLLYWSDRPADSKIAGDDADESMGFWAYALEDTDERYDPWLDQVSCAANQGTLRRDRYIGFRSNRLIIFLSLPWAFHGNHMTITARRIFSPLPIFLDGPTIRKLIPRIGAVSLRHEEKFTKLSKSLGPAGGGGQPAAA